MARRATDKTFHNYFPDDIWVSKKEAPTSETICDEMTKQVRVYFNIPALTDPDMGVKVKGRKKKSKEKPLTPQQRAAQDFGATWAMETFGEGEEKIQVEVYTYQGVRMRFFMANKEFKVVP